MRKVGKNKMIDKMRRPIERNHKKQIKRRNTAIEREGNAWTTYSSFKHA